MGRRSRKRSSAVSVRAGDPGAAAGPAREDATTDAPAPRRTPPTTRRARLDEAPQPPWAPFPLTEICIALGLVVLGVGLLGGGGSRGPLLAFGLSIVTLATLELAWREHFAGYRSHSALLGGLAAMIVAVPLAVLVRPSKAIVLLVAAAVFLLASQLFREAFRRRTGGMSWRA